MPGSGESPRSLRLFLCHASGDKQAARYLYKQLSTSGYEPWLDEEDILPGQHWEIEIPRAVRNSDVVLVCLSRESIDKTGYVQNEIGIALDEAAKQTEDSIFVVPVRLELCAIPERLSRLQWVDLYDQNGYGRLIKALSVRAKALAVELPIDGEIIQALRSFLPQDDLFVAPDIPPSKLANARACCNVPFSEIALGLIDCTTFGSAKNAVVLTNAGIYFRDFFISRGSLDYSKFPECTFKAHGSGVAAEVKTEPQKPRFFGGGSGSKLLISLAYSEVKPAVLLAIIGSISNIIAARVAK